MQEQRTTDTVDWAAGLFEGEGNLTFRGKTSAEAMLGMCDGDVVARFAAVVGFGAIHFERKKNPVWRGVYHWSASNAKDVRTLVQMFLPFLGERRRAKALAVMERTDKCLGPSRARTHCRKGHPYNEVDTYRVPRTNYRQCRICQRERDELARQRPEIRERLRLKAAAWRAEHRDLVLARRRASYHKNKTKEV